MINIRTDSLRLDDKHLVVAKYKFYIGLYFLDCLNEGESNQVYDMAKGQVLCRKMNSRGIWGRRRLSPYQTFVFDYDTLKLIHVEKPSKNIEIELNSENMKFFELWGVLLK
jgi:hypothetical protein